MKYIYMIFFLVLVSGCASPRYTANKVAQNVSPENDVVIIKDPDTKEGFLLAISDWLTENGYEFEIQDEGSNHDLEKVTIEYIGYWNWDLAIYLSEARVEAFHQGQRIGEVNYRAPNTLSTVKFGEARERIFYMMDVLFGQMSASEATKVIKSTKNK